MSGLSSTTGISLPVFFTYLADLIDRNIKRNGRPGGIGEAVVVQQDGPASVGMLENTDEIVALGAIRDGRVF